MTTPNVPLLKQTLAQIEAHPESWNQETYRCRTGMCFAGWACQLAGGTWYKAVPGGVWSDELIAVPDDPSSEVFTLSDGVRLVSAEYRARRILGLSEDNADDLFDAHSTIGTLRRIVGELCGEAS